VPSDPYEIYADYESQFDPMRTDRQARRKRKAIAEHKPKKDERDIIAEITDAVALEGGFETSYKPSKYERGWLLSSIRSFYDRMLITDIEALVKGGKEACVYRCRAHPVTGKELIAVKVYRPRMFRNLRNDKVYREGRETLTSSGTRVNEGDRRIMKAIGKKTAFGAQVQHTSWLMHEYTCLERLWRAGASVPEPLACTSNAILMSYHGDENGAAPQLNTVSLEPVEASRLFHEVLENIAMMLEHDLIHGDLSAYNVLYWDGSITLIDFPQIINCFDNPYAHRILARDIRRVCDYFRRQGVPADADATLAEYWERYVGRSPFRPVPAEVLEQLAERTTRA